MAEKKENVEATVRTIRRVTRKKYSAEEKVWIVLEGRRGETSIAGLCRAGRTRYGLARRAALRSRERGFLWMRTGAGFSHSVSYISWVVQIRDRIKTTG